MVKEHSVMVFVVKEIQCFRFLLLWLQRLLGWFYHIIHESRSIYQREHNYFKVVEVATNSKFFVCKPLSILFHWMNVLFLLNIPSSVFSQLIFLIQPIAHRLAYFLPYLAPFFLVAINTNCYSSWPTVAVLLNRNLFVVLSKKIFHEMIFL